jgi:hypothetical protein
MAIGVDFAILFWSACLVWLGWRVLRGQRSPFRLKAAGAALMCLGVAGVVWGYLVLTDILPLYRSASL